ncbi:MAG: chitinase [Psychromonas sp.]|nr:chitinase [Psychromonas sp.]
MSIFLKNAINKLTYNLKFKKSIIAASVLSVFAFNACAVTSAPSKPLLTNQWANYHGAGFVKLNGETGAYNTVVTQVDVVQLPVSWTPVSGTTSWEVLVDDIVATKGTGVGGSATVPIKKGGMKKIVVRVCNSDGCTDSDADKAIVADTDGSHLEPLVSHVLPGNIDYAQQKDKVVAAYFVEWGVYARKYYVENIPANNLTHVLYGFIPICGANESLKVANPSGWAILQADCSKSQDSQIVIHDMGSALYRQNGIDKAMELDGTPVGYGEIGAGNFGHLMALKKANPHLKILPSIGGWTLSDPFFKMVNKANRDVFVASAKKFLETWKFFDGIDIDWENPGGGGANPALGDPDKDGPAYIALMQQLRAMLDQLGAKNHRTYELTSAVNIGYDKLKHVDYGSAAKYLDHIFMMSYDFYGGWANKTGNQTGIYCGATIPEEKCKGTGSYQGQPEYTLENGTKILLKDGVPAKKLVVGVADYGRGWVGVEPGKGAPMGSMATGPIPVDPADWAWEIGVIDYRGAVKFMKNHPTAKMMWDDTAKASYIYDAPTKTLISLDTPRSVAEKGKYLQSLGLGGIFSWELDGDSNGDLLNAMNLAVGNKPGKTNWTAHKKNKN